jgi:sec-independent protein translocase protein TatB
MFFDFPEIVIIFGVALVVLGPKKLPGTAAQIGRWVGRARAMARQFREQLEQEVGSVEDALDTKTPPREPTIRAPQATPPGTTPPGTTPPGTAQPGTESSGPPLSAPQQDDFEASLAATGASWSPESETHAKPADPQAPQTKTHASSEPESR